MFKQTSGRAYELSHPLLLRACAVFFVISFFPVYLPNFPGSGVASYLAPFLIALPAFLALFGYLGPRRAVVSLLAVSAFAFFIETTGVVTGLPYGPFEYGDVLGPKVLGIVPYMLPVTYVPLVVGAFAAVWNPRRPKTSIFGAALLLTLVDGVLDPGAVSLGFWIWAGGGIYYGVPLSNYVGWLISSILAAAILRCAGRWAAPPHPGLLDSAILAVAFWTGVAAFSLLPVPTALGAGLFVYLLRRRSKRFEEKPGFVSGGINGGIN